LLFACLSAFSGCAGQQLFTHNAEPHRDRQARQETAVRHFEEQRDQAQFYAAMNDWQQGNVPRCHRALQLILARNPEHRQARLLLAELYLYDHQPEQALEILIAQRDSHQNRTALLLDEDAVSQHTLGLAYEALGDAARARSCYRRAAELQPENELFAWSYEAAIEELRLVEGDGLQAEDDPGFVRPAIHERPILDGISNVPDAHADHAEANVEMSDSADSGADVQTIVALIEVTDPELGRGREPVAQQRGSGVDFGQRSLHGQSEPAEIDSRPLSHGRPARSVAPRELPSLARESSTGPDEAILRAVAALEQDDPARAVEISRTALREQSDSAALYRILGVAEYRQDNYAASQSALQQALSLDNSSGLSYFLMGCTLAKLGQQAAAERHFARARALDPRF